MMTWLAPLCELCHVCQALDSGPPPLGHAQKQYNAVHAAQQRLRETQLAEAGSFWALSNHFIMKEVCFCLLGCLLIMAPHCVSE